MQCLFLLLSSQTGSVAFCGDGCPGAAEVPGEAGPVSPPGQRLGDGDVRAATARPCRAAPPVLAPALCEGRAEASQDLGFAFSSEVEQPRYARGSGHCCASVSSAVGRESYYSLVSDAERVN